jgi:hypothetical protein
LGGKDQKDHGSKLAPHKEFIRPYLKNTQHKKMAGRVAQVVECLPCKHDALSSNQVPLEKKYVTPQIRKEQAKAFFRKESKQ